MIIKSILDSDLYKFTMMYAVLSNKALSNLKVRYNFFNRNDVKFPDGFDFELKKEIQEMSKLKLTHEEKLFFMNKCGSYLPIWFFDFLEGYRFDPNEVSVFMEDGNLKIKIEGFWFRSILWEVHLMAIISELYFRMTNKQYDFNSSTNRNTRLDNNKRKSQLMVMNGIKVSDFSTRRRYSYDNQKEMLGDLLSYGRGSITGTSNVHLAHLFNINPQGTNAHEFYMVHAALFGYQLANKLSMDSWIFAYEGNLGTILTDTFTTDEFLKTFDIKSSKLCDGVRCDSGNMYEYADKIVNHYKSLGIDPLSKTIIFSDGLDVETAVKVNDYCRKIGIKSAFGIGTNLSNDLGFKPLNMVIKVTQVYFNGEWHDTVKLSDNLGKHTGNLEEIQLCKKVLHIKEIVYDRQPSGNEGDKPKINTI